MLCWRHKGKILPFDWQMDLGLIENTKNIWHKYFLRVLGYVLYFGFLYVVLCLITHRSDLINTNTLYAKSQTFVVRPVVYVNVAYAWCTPQVHSPFSCVIAVIVNCTLTTPSSTIIIQTIYGILAAKISPWIRPGMFLPRRFFQC